MKKDVCKNCGKPKGEHESKYGDLYCAPIEGSLLDRLFEPSSAEDDIGSQPKSSQTASSRKKVYEKHLKAEEAK